MVFGLGYTNGHPVGVPSLPPRLSALRGTGAGSRWGVPVHPQLSAPRGNGHRAYRVYFLIAAPAGRCPPFRGTPLVSVPARSGHRSSRLTLRSPCARRLRRSLLSSSPLHSVLVKQKLSRSYKYMVYSAKFPATTRPSSAQRKVPDLALKTGDHPKDWRATNPRTGGHRPKYR